MTYLRNYLTEELWNLQKRCKMGNKLIDRKIVLYSCKK